MIKTILQAADVPGREGWYDSPPKGNYVLWFDDVTTDGPDGHPEWVKKHDVILELYEPVADPAVEAALEAAMNVQGCEWTKQGRLWLKDLKHFQVIYEFSYTEKRRT